MIAVKICGLTDEEAVKAVVAARADYAGFVYFPPSPRHLPIDRARELRRALPESVRAVSVVADADDALLADIRDTLAPDFFQLHGKETPERVLAIKKKYSGMKIIKALSVRTSDDIAQAMRYAGAADMLLFDAKAPGFLMSALSHRERGGASRGEGNVAKSPHPARDASHPLPEGEDVYLPGGNGLSFDWNLLKGRQFALPWMLSGGLNAENVGEAIRATGAAAVDVSSSVERAPGVKDPALIEQFVKAAKAA